MQSSSQLKTFGFFFGYREDAEQVLVELEVYGYTLISGPTPVSDGGWHLRMAGEDQLTRWELEKLGDTYNGEFYSLEPSLWKTKK